MLGRRMTTASEHHGNCLCEQEAPEGLHEKQWMNTETKLFIICVWGWRNTAFWWSVIPLEGLHDWDIFSLTPTAVR